MLKNFLSKRMSFQLWPAIDLLKGKPVRLVQGDYEKKTEYHSSFSEITETFSAFAHGIHVVDLDGAKVGKPQNINAIQNILKYTSLPVEVGGGIRSLSDIEGMLSLGVSRIILGTSALKNLSFVQEALETFGTKKIVVGIDVKNGFPAIQGWQETENISLQHFLKNLVDVGVQTIIVTDIATDGMLSGPAIPLFQEIQKDFPQFSLIASGGVSCLNDLEKLREEKLSGVVFGKAFYENRISLEELIAFSKEK